MTQNSWNSEYNSAIGDLLVGNGTRPVVVPVGADGSVLTADSGQPEGVSWSATPPFSAVNIQTFTADGTYTPTAGMKYCLVEAVGGGGGGGGAGAGGGGAGGGSSGGYTKAAFTAATIGVSQAVTIGAAGTGGTSAPTNGVAGGATSLGALLTANGGLGGFQAGQTGAGGATSRAGAAAGSTAGEIAGSALIVGGNPSQSSWVMQLGASVLSYSAMGAASYYGGAGAARTAFNSGQAGIAATGYGSGGGGAASHGTGGAVAGGDGFAGVLVVTEFIG